MIENYEDSDEFSHEKSKSQIKKELLELTALGEKLSQLSPQQWETLPVSNTFLNALKEVPKINHHTGLKRHIKFLGKLLRNEDVDAIEQQLVLNNQQHTLEVQREKLCEHWRDRLLQEGDQATFELLQVAPNLERQHLRQLVRNATKEKSLNKPPKYQRELFRYLRDFAEFKDD
ncbi:ribosome biogenesis factor YjgA [Kangiella shandongensis]|uniref:ribosome biogenesis factor YjgA n=1 Tax=Kangiella shandongensis TaxID=2763258 RepID=UPI001CBF8341|nr:ribosome biogenesis factor YjgA [Kangiella shandongensis]